MVCIYKKNVFCVEVMVVKMKVEIKNKKFIMMKEKKSFLFSFSESFSPSEEDDAL